MTSSQNGSSAGKKTPMLLLHGFTGTPVMWEPVIPFLEEHHEIYAPHLPGHHLGPAFTDPKDHIADALVDILEEMMDERGWERAHIVGNSLGGWGALLLADRRRALSTVAISPAGGWQLGSSEARRAQAIFVTTQLQMSLFGPTGLPWELARRPRGRKLILDIACAHPERLTARQASLWVDATADTPAWKMMLKYAPSVNAPTTMDGLDGPVRIAWGTRDKLLPFKRYSPGWKAVLPDADWVALDGLGHVPMSDDPELVAKTILDVTAVPHSEVVEPE